MKQANNGKAFEYALATAFTQITNAKIQENSSFQVASACYETLDSAHRSILEKASNETALFLQAPAKHNHSACWNPSNIGLHTILV